MNLYIYDVHGQQIGIVGNNEQDAHRWLERWAQRYGHSAEWLPRLWTKALSGITPGVVIESLPLDGNTSGLDAYMPDLDGHA